MPASASTARDRLRGAVGARAHDQLRAALGADPSAGVDDRTLLGGVERGRFAGGAERDDPGAAGVEVLVTELFDRVEGDRAVGGERRDQRDVDALEQSASLLGREGHGPRGYRAGRLAGPEKDGVEHRLGELAGERVLLRRVVAADAR